MKIAVGGKHAESMGGFALCSEDRYEELSKYTWAMTKDGYITAKVGRKRVLVIAKENAIK